MIFFVKDFQLYADIARELPLIKTDHLSSGLSDNDTLTSIDDVISLNIEDYL